MRADFHHQLDQLRADLGGMCALAGRAMSRATRGLLDVDADAACQVSLDVDRLHFLHNAIERHTLAILATQAPVAGDLRTVVTSIHIAADADRMGDLASHVAKLSLRRHPEPVVPEELRSSFREMGRIATEATEHCRAALIADDCAKAHRVRQEDQAMETLHRELFGTVTSEHWPHGPGVASDVVLLGRFYGRFADRADGIARRVIFQRNGRVARGARTA